MLTVGIDLAAEPERTGMAWITWEPGRAVVTKLICGADDAVILDAISGGEHADLCRRSHDAADAVTAALSARAAALALTIPPGGNQLPAARTEGWIAIPEESSLDLLA